MPTVVGYSRDIKTAVVASNRAEILLVVPPDQVWEYERFSVRCTSTATSAVRVYVGSEADANLVDGSDSGNLDVADNSAPVRVGPGEVLRIVWSGTPDNGSVCSFNGQRTNLSASDDVRRGYRPGVLADYMPGKHLPASTRRRKVTKPYGGGW